MREGGPSPRLPVLSLLLLGGFPLAGCGGETEAPRPDGVLQEALGLSGSEEIHRIVLGGRGDRVHVVPARLEIQEGALVEFTILDGRIHTVVFLLDDLSSRAADFLVRTGQDRSPPLLERGARFVLTFEGAPAGVYPFQSRAHGDPVRGEIVVREP